MHKLVTVIEGSISVYIRGRRDPDLFSIVHSFCVLGSQHGLIRTVHNKPICYIHEPSDSHIQTDKHIKLHSPPAPMSALLSCP